MLIQESQECFVIIDRGQRLQGTVLEEDELEALIHTYDKDGNSVFDLVVILPCLHNSYAIIRIR
jgi:hypothetical protein